MIASRRRLRIAAVGLTALLPAAALGGASTSAPVAGGERIHEVRAGETLYQIAKRYSVTAADLVEINRLENAGVKLKIGQKLRIPAATTAATPRRAAERAPVRATIRPPITLTLALPDLTDLTPIFAWPVEGPISSPFGRRRSGWHRGIDIKADLGVPIVASAAGVVVASGYERRYGRVIKIEHPLGFVSVYAHNDENMVEIGDRVFAGQRIAVVGRTGRATAHHLHFEIRQGDLAYDPLYLLPLPRRFAHVEETDEEDSEHDE